MTDAREDPMDRTQSLDEAGNEEPALDGPLVGYLLAALALAILLIA